MKQNIVRDIDADVAAQFDGAVVIGGETIAIKPLAFKVGLKLAWSGYNLDEVDGVATLLEDALDETYGEGTYERLTAKASYDSIYDLFIRTRHGAKFPEEEKARQEAKDAAEAEKDGQLGNVLASLGVNG